MNTSRVALAEIPERLEQLRVAPSPTDNLVDETNILNQTVFDNPLNNIAMTYYSTPIPSPDEIVIRQRGRRRITLSYSPEKCPARSPFQKTPTKIAGIQSSMVLRSSPRKRLLNESTPTTSNDRAIKNNYNNNHLNYNDGMSPRKNNWTDTPIVKKFRLDEKPIAQINTDIPLCAQLKGLSKEQLIGIIKKLTIDDPNIETKIRKEFPMPDIAPMECELMAIKKNIFKSLPTTRLCKKTDSSSYAKAAPYLNALKKSIITNTKLLHDSGHWDALLNYIQTAWNYVRATPIWDNNSQNADRRNCFKILAYNCLEAVKYGGNFLSEERLYDMQRSINEWSKDSDDILLCAGHLKKLLNDVIKTK